MCFNFLSGEVYDNSWLSICYCISHHWLQLPWHWSNISIPTLIIKSNICRKSHHYDPRWCPSWLSCPAIPAIPRCTTNSTLKHNWLVVWNMKILFVLSVGNFIIPTDELHHVSEGVYHQPDNVSTPKAHGKDIFVPTMSITFDGDLLTRSFD